MISTTNTITTVSMVFELKEGTFRHGPGVAAMLVLTDERMEILKKKFRRIHACLQVARESHTACLLGLSSDYMKGKQCSFLYVLGCESSG
jgi:hypothetical protein